jgi:hypothetical protein
MKKNYHGHCPGLLHCCNISFKKAEEIIKHPRIYFYDSEIDIQKTRIRNTEKIQVGRHST